MKHDRYRGQLIITFNAPLTDMEMHVLLEELKTGMENRIAESEVMTNAIGHVALESPTGELLEICP